VRISDEDSWRNVVLPVAVIDPAVAVIVHVPAIHAYTAEVATPVEIVYAVFAVDGIAQPVPATVNVTGTPART